MHEMCPIGIEGNEVADDEPCGEKGAPTAETATPPSLPGMHLLRQRMIDLAVAMGMEKPATESPAESDAQQEGHDGITPKPDNASIDEQFHWEQHALHRLDLKAVFLSLQRLDIGHMTSVADEQHAERFVEQARLYCERVIDCMILIERAAEIVEEIAKTHNDAQEDVGRVGFWRVSDDLKRLPVLKQFFAVFNGKNANMVGANLSVAAWVYT